MPGAGPPWPSDYVAAEEIAARVRAALARLPAKRQKIALLRLDAGLGYDEIANVVGTTEGSARVLVHHVLRDLRAELGDLLGKEALHGPSAAVGTQEVAIVLGGPILWASGRILLGRCRGTTLRYCCRSEPHSL